MAVQVGEQVGVLVAFVHGPAGKNVEAGQENGLMAALEHQDFEAGIRFAKQGKCGGRTWLHGCCHPHDFSRFLSALR
ncbi:hypothetical protein RE428_47770 [Marinobacter nanhaiticus D15-8W]|nr:hypothetical protein RE428_47770 [Marinobacter nanhaiticus D15-8W]